MRLATYNIRNLVALDWASFWFRRRSALGRVISGIDVDVWVVQEAYRTQIRYLNRSALPGWAVVGEGRNSGGGGEACPIWARPGWAVSESVTLWFGDAPDRPGARLADARAPRIATIAVVEGPDIQVALANTHLDEKSPARRQASVVQLVGWLADRWPELPHVIAGDLNATLDSPPARALLDAGYRPALSPDDGPTSNGFGDDAGAKQIDHVFVSAALAIDDVSIRRDAGLVSDHWPVVVNLSLRL